MTATAFAVDSTRLVTNAHVVEGLADILSQYGSSVRCVVVQHETGTVLEIEKLWKHPTYDSGAVVSPDVGVISVSGTLPAALALADDTTVRQLQVFDELRMCGFPGDVTNIFEIGLGSVRPRATCLQGQVTALRPMDPNEPASPENTVLIQHDVATSAGTSGSAILDAAGRVVAVNSAATKDNTALNRFAVRADLARELLGLIDSGASAGTALADFSTPPSPPPELPPMPGVCPLLSYTNPLFGFGFNPPSGFIGPWMGNQAGSHLLDVRFKTLSSVEVAAWVDTCVFPNVDAWVSGWIGAKMDAGQQLLANQRLIMASGKPLVILEWYDPEFDAGIIEAWVVSGGLLYEMHAFLFSAYDVTLYEPSILQSFSTMCVK